MVLPLHSVSLAQRAQVRQQVQVPQRAQAQVRVQRVHGRQAARREPTQRAQVRVQRVHEKQAARREPTQREPTQQAEPHLPKRSAVAAVVALERQTPKSGTVVASERQIPMGRAVENWQEAHQTDLAVLPQREEAEPSLFPSSLLSNDHPLACLERHRIVPYLTALCLRLALNALGQGPPLRVVSALPRFSAEQAALAAAGGVLLSKFAGGAAHRAEQG